MRDRLMSWKARASTALPPRVQMDAARTTYIHHLVSLWRGCKATEPTYHFDCSWGEGLGEGRGLGAVRRSFNAWGWPLSLELAHCGRVWSIWPNVGRGVDSWQLGAGSATACSLHMARAPPGGANQMQDLLQAASFAFLIQFPTSPTSCSRSRNPPPSISQLRPHPPLPVCVCSHRRRFIIFVRGHL